MLMSDQRSISTVAFEQGRLRSRDPNICAVGYGVKLRAGSPVAVSPDPCLVFFVRRKLASQAEVALQGTWPIPPVVDGFPTDVVELGTPVAAASDRTPPAGSRGTRVGDPLVGGVATSSLGSAASGPGGFGTLGGLAFDTASSEPVVLSNAHVWGQAVGTEVIQPVIASAVLGTPSSPATLTAPVATVLSRIPPGLVTPVVFANAVAQTVLVTGGDDDLLPQGQAAAPVAADVRTESDQVTVSAPAASLPPAGRKLSPSLSVEYRRVATTTVLDAALAVSPPQGRLLAGRRLFTNGAAFSGSQVINLYAEIIPAATSGPATAASSHFILVLLYPLLAGGRFVPRVLAPTSRQTPTAVTTSFQGFPAPARLGPALLPETVGDFTVDGDSGGSFVPPPAGLPAGTFALALPGGQVRLFVPPSTEVKLDIDLTAIVGFSSQALNSAGETVAAGTVGSGTGGRSLVTLAASEIAEVRLTSAMGAKLVGVTSKRASPETSPPLCYAATVVASDLAAIFMGRWAATLMVQSLDGGVPESANVIETAIGSPSLIADCTFDIS
jgi:hypothetical protein